MGAPISISHYLYLQSYHISKTSFLPEFLEVKSWRDYRGCDIVQECPLEARTDYRMERSQIYEKTHCTHFSVGSKCKKDTYAMMMIMMRIDEDWLIDLDVCLSTYDITIWYLPLRTYYVWGIFTVPVKSGWLCTIRFLHYSIKESFFCAIQIFWAKFPPSIYIDYIYIMTYINIYVSILFHVIFMSFILENQPKPRVFYRRSLDLIVSGSVLTFTPDLPETLEKLLGRPTRYQSKMVKPPVVKKSTDVFLIERQS